MRTPRGSDVFLAVSFGHYLEGFNEECLGGFVFCWYAWPK